MFKISVPIKQCTPIIHFQSDQTGATLRATELKPKLDRYLIQVLQLTEIKIKNGEQVEVPKSSNESWFLNKEKHLSLDYKVKIIDEGEKDKFLPYSIHLNPNKKRSLTNELRYKHIDDILYPCPFFANNNSIKFAGQNIESIDYDNLKFAVFEPSDKAINLEIFSYIPELIQKIKAHIHTFFAVENFGTRQSKGFGCFKVEDKSYQDAFNGLNLSSLNIDSLLIWDFKNWKKPGNNRNNNSKSTFENFFDKVSSFYNVLKSGQNHSGYFKSELMKYFYHQPVKLRWEKAKIKKEIKENHETIWDNLRQENRIETSPFSDKDAFSFVRALLGLAEFIEFSQIDGGRQKIYIKNKKIERFRSPIVFKFDGNKAYLICYKIPEQLHKNGKYKFALDKDFTQVLDELTVPSDFSLSAFFESIWYDEGKETRKTIAQHYNLRKI